MRKDKVFLVPVFIFCGFPCSDGETLVMRQRSYYTVLASSPEEAVGRVKKHELYIDTLKGRSARHPFSLVEGVIQDSIDNHPYATRNPVKMMT